MEAEAEAEAEVEVVERSAASARGARGGGGASFPKVKRGAGGARGGRARGEARRGAERAAVHRTRYPLHFRFPRVPLLHAAQWSRLLLLGEFSHLCRNIIELLQIN